MIWFSSDWHIGHDKDFLYMPRGCTNVYEHDTLIIKNCNQLVKPDDELWILGDLALGINEEEWNRVFYSINCQNIHFVIGNHDSDKRIDKYIDEYNMELHGYADVIKYSKRKRFYVSHYPTITDNFERDKEIRIINLFGHTHQHVNFFNNNPYMYHVGLDSHNMYPVSLEQIIKEIENKKKE